MKARLATVTFVSSSGFMEENKTIINRELSWLAFNERVLKEAVDSTVPLMERLKFLGIFSNNRDEFFRVRVASVKRLMQLEKREKAGIEDPKSIFKKIQEITIKQQREYEQVYRNIIAELDENGVHLINETKLNKSQRQFVKQYFEDEVDPVIGPIMLKQIKTFPQLRDKGIYLAIILNSPEKKHSEYALMEVPSMLPRFLEIPGDDTKKFIIILDDIIRLNLMDVFQIFRPESVEAYTFKITRDAELDLDNDITKSFLEKMKASLKERKRGAPVRFVYDAEMPKELQRYLAKKMHLTNSEDAFIPGGRYHNLRDLMSFPRLKMDKGYYRPLVSHEHPHLRSYETHFDAIKAKDILLHFPYQSFNHVIEFLKEAAVDPKVKTIKICLYRVAKRSKVVNALINARRNGKHVIVVFELQARFDEESNIYWSNILEDEGVDVYFGFPGLKVHSKICIITRKEQSKSVQYGYVGTGNFHEGTSGLYTDFSLLTADKRITKEIDKVFEMFEHSIWRNYRFQHLLVSPFYLRNKLVRFINIEIKNAKAGRSAYIHLKMNSIVDTSLIEKLYAASNAGVKVRLVVRGICSLIPGIEGLSENIEVISIIDRYLEHARFYCFCNDGNPLYFISSADWMVRNIDRRIEVTCPIYSKEIIEEIDHTFEVQFSDNVKGRRLQSDGQYKVQKKKGDKRVKSQSELFQHYKMLAKK